VKAKLKYKTLKIYRFCFPISDIWHLAFAIPPFRLENFAIACRFEKCFNRNKEQS
jgi:hypothetical protein